MKFTYRNANIYGSCSVCNGHIDEGTKCVYVGYGGCNKTHFNCMPQLMEEMSIFIGTQRTKLLEEMNKNG